MNLFGFWKRQSNSAPVEVIQAACNLYGTSPERVSTLKAEKLKALSNAIWVVQIDEQKSAVVAYTPDEEQHTTSAPWFGE